MRRLEFLLLSSKRASRRACPGVPPRLALACLVALHLGLVGCGAEQGEPTGSPQAAPAPDLPAPRPAAGPQTPDALPNALVLGLAQFGPREPGKPPKPLPATLEFVTRDAGEWKVTSLEDDESNVFHKAMP
jgi:hypothetical protein